MRGLLASPLGFLIGISLGALGGGGSILAVPALVYAAGQGATEATTTSLVLVAITSLVGIVPHWRAGRVRVGAGLAFGLSGVAGSLIGSRANAAVDPDVLLLGFAGLMLVAARAMWKRASIGTAGNTAPTADGNESHHTTDTSVVTRRRVDTTTVVRVLAAGTVVGLLTGFFGVGGGFVIVPALVLALGFTMPDAVGTSLLVITVNALVALSTRLDAGAVDWGVVAPFTIASLIGVMVGSRLSGTRDPRVLQRWFVVLLVVVALYTGGRSVAALV